MEGQQKPVKGSWQLNMPEGLVPTRHPITDFNPFRDKMPTTLMPRPQKFNSSGKEVGIYINSHRILSYPTKKIWQYDVSKAGLAYLKLNSCSKKPNCSSSIY